MRWTAFLLGLSCVCWSLTQACGGDTGSGLDGSTDGTVGNDVNNPPPDSGGQDVVNNNDTGTSDTGTNDTGTSDASDGGTITDSGIAYRCGDSGTVTDCSQCTGFIQPCVYCAFTDASVHEGICTPFHTNCFNALPPNSAFVDCPCNNDASTCPESYQVCVGGGGGRCHTCSDQTGNNGLKCENGGTCDYTDGGCL